MIWDSFPEPHQAIALPACPLSTSVQFFYVSMEKENGNNYMVVDLRKNFINKSFRDYLMIYNFLWLIHNDESYLQF